jgi:beta-glucanase (GH16 family)
MERPSSALREPDPSLRSPSIDKGAVHDGPLGEIPMKWKLALVAACAAVCLTGVPAASLEVKSGPKRPAPIGASDACGPQIAKATGGSWACSFVDEFKGGSLNRKFWVPVTEAQGAFGACTVDDPKTVGVHDGSLRLTVRPVGAGLQCPASADGSRLGYASASVSTYYRFSQQFGRFEARIKTSATTAPGLHEAFWLWPDVRSVRDVAAAGEIDIAEMYSAYPDLAVPFLHYGDDAGPVLGLNTAWDCVAPRGEFHTYTLEWFADRLDIYVDGRLCLSNTDGAATFANEFIVMLTQALGASGINAVNGLTPMPATMEVDYVRVWR